MTFADAIAWLDARVGTRVTARVSSGVELGGNSGASLDGILTRKRDFAWQTIDSRGGARHCFAIGDACVFLLEGDFGSAEENEDEGVLLMDLRELQVNVTAAPAGE